MRGKDHGKNELTLEELAKQIYKGQAAWAM